MPICVGRSKATAQTGLSRFEQQAKALVGRARRAEARVLAHRPETTAVHRGLHATREGKLAGIGRGHAHNQRVHVVRTDDAVAIGMPEGESRSAHPPNVSDGDV